MIGEQWTGKTVLVTGALGFIGSHFVEELVAHGATVFGLYRTQRPAVIGEISRDERVSLINVDLLDDATLRFTLRNLVPSIDTVIHCAALDGNAAFKREYSAEILDANLRMTSNLLNVVRDFHVNETIMLSSSEVYCSPTTSPTSEDDALVRTIQSSDNGYILSKIFGEVLAEHYHRQYATNIYLVRPVNVYGPRDSFDQSKSRVIPTMLTKADAGEEIEIWGDGSQTRSFVHVSDLVRASLRLAETGKYQSLNVAGSEEISMLDLAKVIASVLGRPERIRIDPTRTVGAAGRSLDLSRMREVIDFTPWTLREGLEETVRWFRRHK